MGSLQPAVGSDGTALLCIRPYHWSVLLALNLQAHDLADGQEAYVAEVFYNYQVIFTKIIKYSPKIYSITVL